MISLEIMSKKMDTGIVVAFAGNKIPPGWALCDGTLQDRTLAKWKPLFGVIGTIHGGDGNQNFQLPDYRGIFLRGVDGTAGRDPDKTERLAPGKGNTGNTGNSIGSIQSDGFQAHSHQFGGKHLEGQGGAGFDGAGFESNSNPNHPWTQPYGTTPVGSQETRPKNAYVSYIIKL